MIHNRSMPPGTIIPELVYPDFNAAIEWLCRVFGFSERVRIADHRSQLVFGDSSVVVIAGSASQIRNDTHSVMVRIEDVNQHYERTRQAGAAIVREPRTYPFGERQYTVEDLAGHRWTFTQSVADVAPEEWGGKTITPPPKKIRMDHLALPVADYARSRDWYMRNLGMQIEFEVAERRMAALKDEADLTIFLYEKTDGRVAPSCTLTFQVDDVDAKYRELTATGVTFDRPPQKLMWGYGAELRDPDGYAVYLWDEKSMREKG